MMIASGGHLTRQVLGAMLSSLALLGGALAGPANAAQPLVRAHIALGCQAGVQHHQRHHGLRRERCQAPRLGHVVLAHMA